jgi:hypothetical protein
MNVRQWRRKACPECGWEDTRLSSRRKLLDYFLMPFLIFPYRCRACGIRFRRFTLEWILQRR